MQVLQWLGIGASHAVLLVAKVFIKYHFASSLQQQRYMVRAFWGYAVHACCPSAQSTLERGRNRAFILFNGLRQAGVAVIYAVDV